MTRTHRDAPLTGSDLPQEFFLPRQWLLAQDISDKFDRITAIQRDEIVKLFPVCLCLLRHHYFSNGIAGTPDCVLR
jgi:hypothetical protein